MPRHVAGVLGVPVLVGLFGIAVGLGTLGRAWSGPAVLLSHLDQWGTATLGAALSVLFNNLPAASLLAARTPPHPYALLVGLNLGPNLFVTGSLAWVLWLRSARAAGVQPSIATAARIGARGRAAFDSCRCGPPDSDRSTLMRRRKRRATIGKRDSVHRDLRVANPKVVTVWSFWGPHHLDGTNE